jgi:hypothetical protein
MIYKIFASLLVLLVTSGCAIKANVVKHDEQSSSKAKNFTPDEMLAKVYFLTTTKDNIFKFKQGYSADLKINDTVIGSINDDNVMYFKLRPGSYKFQWLIRSSDIIESRGASVDFPYRVAAGDVVILRGKYNPGGAAGFGLIGALVSPPKYEMEISTDRDLIRELEVAAPQSCPSNICVTTSPASISSINAKDKLSELNEMRKKGLISQKEYDTKKTEILKSM